MSTFPALRRAALICVPLLASVVASPSVRAARQTAPAIQLFVMPESHASPVLQLIRSARRSIRLEVYMLTSRPIVDELQKARERGVDVRVMLEEHPTGGGRYAALGYSELRSAGVSVQWANEGAFTLTHEKAMVVDDRTAGIFSFNLTSSGLYSNREFGIVDTDARDVRTLAAVFDGDWKRQVPVYAPDARIVLSPYNSRKAFDSIIDGARRTLDLYAEEVNDPSIESHLVRAAARRVRVRLITSQASAGVDTLRRGGVSVKILQKPYIHAKAIVADGAALFVGSENISTTSLDRNREAGLMVTDTGMASRVEGTFASDWKSAGDASVPATRPGTTGSRGSLVVRVSVSPAVARRGADVTITAHTAPGALCSVRATYPDGYVSRSRSLARTLTADSAGSVSWTWRMSSTVSGQARAGVTCEANGRQASGSATFTIE